MQIYRCSNLDCNKRSSQAELDENDGCCPYCGETMFYRSTNYKPVTGSTQPDDDEEPRVFDWN